MSEAEPGPKLFYLATRNPALSREEFRARWRGHFRLASGLPRWVNVLRYAQCDTITGLNAKAPLTDRFDGVAMIWWKSADAHRRHFGDTSSQAIMEADEDEVFFERVVNFAMLARETIVRDGPRSLFKLVTFLRRAPGSNRAAFVEYCANTYARAVLDASGSSETPTRYVQNHDLAAQPRTAGLPHEMIDELSFASADAAMRYCNNVVYRPGFPTDHAVSERFSILTEEHILYGVSNEALSKASPAFPSRMP